MAMRWLSSSSVAFAISLGFACVVVAACSSSTDETTNDAASAELGAANYDKTCALCHGKNGEGYAADNAVALNNPTFLATASDDFLRRSIKRGRPGTTMSAWDRAHGGPYDDNAVAGIAAYIRTWQTAPSVTLPTSAIAGDATHGATVFASTCATCHGATGTEGPNVRLANAEFLSVASDAFLEYAILHGRPGTAMQAFEGQLSTQDIDDVVALLRSWAKPVATGDVPIPGSLGPIVLNADGPDPNFVVGNRFTPADTIKAEFDRGAAMGFLDARAPSDYVTSHIAGANDVPFYEAGEYVFALPKDKWLVAYCGCPHAESGQLLDTLIANGFTKVTILDEGFYTWVSRGYPVRAGANP